MPSVRHRDLSVGAFAILALIVLSVGIMAVGGESRFFSRKVRYRAVFPSTDGLIVGSPVKMAGVQVGTVSAIPTALAGLTDGSAVEDPAERRIAAAHALGNLTATCMQPRVRSLEVTDGGLPRC